MSDPRIMPEMLKAGMMVLNAERVLDCFDWKVAEAELSVVLEKIYCAMEDARPPGYTTKLLAAMKANIGVSDQ